jgi:hypothetical protein
VTTGDHVILQCTDGEPLPATLREALAERCSQCGQPAWMVETECGMRVAACSAILRAVH